MHSDAWKSVKSLTFGWQDNIHQKTAVNIKKRHTLKLIPMQITLAKYDDEKMFILI